MLISHPLKTAINYMLNGSFIMDVLGSSPLELIFPLIGWTDIFGYGDSAVWYTKFRWTRILQVLIDLKSSDTNLIKKWMVQ